MHRVVSKVILQNQQNQVIMAKVKRGFFTGHWTLPGGFVDYAEHPLEGACDGVFGRLRQAIEKTVDLAANGAIVCFTCSLECCSSLLCPARRRHVAARALPWSLCVGPSVEAANALNAPIFCHGSG